MRFTLTALVALAATAFAQNPDFNPVTKPLKDEVLTAGSTYTIEWQPPVRTAAKYADAIVNIRLIGGATQETQVPLDTIATGVKNSALRYEWKISSALGDKAVYGLVIEVASDTTVFQYSNRFHIKGNGKTTGSATGSATGTASATLTTSHGTKTITLSSSPVPTSTTTTHAQHNTTTSTTIRKTTSSVPSNSTTLTTKPASSTGPVVITSTAIVNPSKTTGATVVPTAGASLVGAGSLSVVAGVFVALMAM
ncbi:hypothetical protein PLICBS_002551 [Purpureocillium lilacinum]|nr:hypothetical protein PLICBS_002551 [Purpureocillium lilacinum]